MPMRITVVVANIEHVSMFKRTKVNSVAWTKNVTVSALHRRVGHQTQDCLLEKTTQDVHCDLDKPLHSRLLP